MGPEFVRDGVELAIAEMLRGGTTCCNENYFFPDVQAATYRKSRIPRARRPAGHRVSERLGEEAATSISTRRSPSTTNSRATH